MKPADLLYSTVGRARRENTERTTGKSSPPGRRFRSPRVSSFIHKAVQSGRGWRACGGDLAVPADGNGDPDA
jgi:hypothetical protein